MGRGKSNKAHGVGDPSFGGQNLRNGSRNALKLCNILPGNFFPLQKNLLGYSTAYMETKVAQIRDVYHYYIGCFSEGNKDAEEIIRNIPTTFQKWRPVSESGGKFLILYSVKTGPAICDMDLRVDAMLITGKLNKSGGKAFYVSRQLCPLVLSQWDGLAASFLSKLPMSMY
jgi:hypothetical protein